VNRKVSKEGMAARVSQIYSGKVKIKKCPKAHLLKRQADPMSLDTVFRLFHSVDLRHLTLWSLVACRIMSVNFGARHLFAKASNTGKLRSDKYQPPAARLLEYYESDSSVEAHEDTDTEVSGDARTSPDVGSATKPRRKTRAAVTKQSVSTAAVKVTAVKVVEKKNRKRKTSPPLAVEIPVIPTPLSREVESNEEDDEATKEPPVVEERSVRRSLSPSAKRQWELVQKTTEDALY
jgi:hypothetical protein